MNNDILTIIYSYYWKTKYHKLVVLQIKNTIKLFNILDTNLNYMILKNKESYENQYKYLLKYNNYIKKFNKLKGEKLLLKKVDNRLNLIFDKNESVFTNNLINKSIQYICITSGYMRYYVLEIYNNIVNYLKEINI